MTRAMIALLIVEFVLDLTTAKLVKIQVCTEMLTKALVKYVQQINILM